MRSLRRFLRLALLAVVFASCGDYPLSPVASGLDPSEVAFSLVGEPVLISDLSVIRTNGGPAYPVVIGGMANGARVYMDRTYTYDNVPGHLHGQTYVQTAQSERFVADQDDLLSFVIDRRASIYIAYHGQAPPPWMSDFTATGETLVVAKNVERMTFHLFSKTYPAGTVTLGSNQVGDARAMYTVIAVPAPAVPGPFASVTAGWRHSCGITTTGKAYCWGQGTQRGQLGDGTYKNSNIPVAVLGGLTFSSLSAGGGHTCGLTIEAKPYCWGLNENGQLGTGDTITTNVPVPVATDLTFVSLGAGGAHSCGLTENGRVFCWGANDRGQLGTGDTAPSLTPARVVGNFTVTTLTVGWEHNCLLTFSAAARCWGKNPYGQLGDGTKTDRSEPVRVVDGHSFTRISTTGTGTGGTGNFGQNHTCALTIERKAYCWGDNYHNALGTSGMRTGFTRPQAVQGVPLFVDIVTGGDHGCGITSAGQMWCWGDNLRGQLGNGPREDYNPAIQVAGGHAFANIAAGWDHTCGVTANGAAFCWGWNHRGQVGDGSDEPTMDRPMLVVTPPM